MARLLAEKFDGEIPITSSSFLMGFYYLTLARFFDEEKYECAQYIYKIMSNAESSRTFGEKEATDTRF